MTSKDTQTAKILSAQTSPFSEGEKPMLVSNEYTLHSGLAQTRGTLCVFTLAHTQY